MIWDLFSYYDEDLVLQVRLAELPDEVQHVAIESRLTLSGHAKPLYLGFWAGREMRDGTVLRWEHNSTMTITAREREDQQRDSGMDALLFHGAQPDDLVLFGDVDEIPSADALLEAVPLARSGALVSLRSPYHSLLATLRLPLERDEWNHRWPVMGTVSTMQRVGGLSAAREQSERLENVVTGGWHLSSMGGPEKALHKVGAFMHYDEPWGDNLDATRLKGLALRGRDIADRFTQEHVWDEDLPQSIVADRVKYAALLDVESW